jgi:hypothetical protein
MKIKVILTKTDIVMLIICVMFLACNLGMIGSKGREMAKRTVCAYQVREHLGGLTASALDNDGNMPLPRNPGNWFWDIDVDVVNQMLDYGLRRNILLSIQSYYRKVYGCLLELQWPMGW